MKESRNSTKMAELIKTFSPPFNVVVVLLDDWVKILQAMLSVSRGELWYKLIEMKLILSQVRAWERNGDNIPSLAA